ncbi:unnamed protein product, partial [Rotaria sordida]
FNQLFSNTPLNKTMNSTDKVLVNDSNKVSIISIPKHVKFLISSDLSDITSNDSTFGIIESTTGQITHVKDIFSVNFPLESQIITKNETDKVISSSSSNSVTNTLLFNNKHQEEIVKNGNEESPLLMNDNFNDK